MSSANQREQWEALVVEPSAWARYRTVTPNSDLVVFDSEDQENLETELQNEFRRMGGFSTNVRRISSIDHPLARFYRLMYTDEFDEFRGSVLKQRVSGVAEISKGVREMLIDQIFRYFVFVEENTVSAIRFGQLIVAVAVFRNTYDDDSKKFIENGVIKSRRRLYKSTSNLSLGRSKTGKGGDETSQYVIMDDYDIPAEYETKIANAIIESVQNKTPLKDVLPLEYYGGFRMEDITFTSPLNVNTSVFNPARKFILHVMHLLGKFPVNDKCDIVYEGKTPYLNLLRDVLPKNFNVVEKIENVDYNRPTFVILDEENGKEASSGVGDDTLLTRQILTVKGLKNNFRSKPENLKAVSLFIRLPSVMSGSGAFNFVQGEIYQTAWKNPMDERMRLVWNPKKFDVELIEYDTERLVNARRFQDYVARSLFKFETLPNTNNFPNGLIDGEFDSELEKFIVGEFYQNYPQGNKSWKEIADLEDLLNIVVPPRFIGETPYTDKIFLYRYHKELVDFHLDIPSNPLLQHAARVLRGGLFPTANLAKTPLTESIDTIFGLRTTEDAKKTLETYNKVVSDRRNVILTMKEKDIFPRESDKTSMVNLIKDLSPKSFREIVQFEPSLMSRQRGEPYMYKLVQGLERGAKVNIVHLGDSFGNLLFDVYDEISRSRLNVNTVYFESTFPMNQIWKNISSDNTFDFERVKSVYELKEPLEKDVLPIILLRGYGYPENIFEAFVKSMYTPLNADNSVNIIYKNKLFRGTIQVTNEGEIQSTASRFLENVSPKERFDKIVSQQLISGVRGSGKSCLFIGSDNMSELRFIVEQRFSRVFHMVDSGAGGRKVIDMTRSGKTSSTSNQVYVRENMVDNFVLPVEGDRYDYVLCHPIVFTRFMKSRATAERFLTEIQKALRPDSIFQTVDLSELVLMAEDEGRTISEYKADKLLTTNLFEIEVSTNTFLLNGSQGFRYNKDNLKTNGGLRHRVIEKNSSYVRRDIDDDEEDYEGGYDVEERIEVVSSMDSTKRFSVTRLTNLLQVIEITSEKTKGVVNVETNAAYEGQAIDVGAKVRAYNNMVKRSLITSVVSPQKPRVLDLACGHGQDIGKWFVEESAITTYLGIDASEQAIEEAERRFKARKGYKPRNNKFLTRDLFGSQEWYFDAQTMLRGKQLFDIASCQLAIHYAFSEEKTIKRFMFNVSSLMEIGGEFIVTTLDDEVIKQMVKEQVQRVGVSSKEIVLRGEHYIVKFQPEMVDRLMSDDVVLPGVSYEFTQFPSDPLSRSTVEYIVDRTYFKRLAAEMGLEFVSSENFLELKDEAVISERNQLTPEDLEVAVFYRTYKFKKIAEPRDAQIMLSKPFRYSDSKQQFNQVTDALGLMVSDKVPQFKTAGLFVGPETCFPAPFVKEGYEAMHVLVEDINNVRDTAKQLQTKNRLTQKERIFISKLPTDQLYELVFVSYSAKPETFINRLRTDIDKKSEMYVVFVSEERINELIPGTDSEFSNYIFDLTVSRREGKFSINTPLDIESFNITNIERVKEMASEKNLDFELVVPSFDTAKELNINQRQFLGLFGMYRLSTRLNIPATVQPQVIPTPATTKPRKSSAAGKKKKTTTTEEPTVIEEEQPEVLPQEEGGSEEDVDKFVLLPGLVQKKAPGKGKDETLNAKGAKGLYKDLGADPRWRFKLSDEWESEEFVIRMPTGETFTSVKNAMIYYKCLFDEEEDQGYKGLNRSSGFPVPQDLKPYTKAIRGKKGAQWKEQEPRVLRQVYEAKFTNTPNVSNDDPENLSPLRLLLLTKSAQLYSNSKTRNELLETIRSVLQRIFN